MYPTELQLNKAYSTDTEAAFLGLHLFISNSFVSSKIYDKRIDFYFDVINFPFLNVDVPRAPSYGVFISQLIWFARVSSRLAEVIARNKILTAKLLQKGSRYHKLRKAFSKKGKRKVQGVPQSQTAALPRPQEKEETDKSKQAQIEQTYEKH